MNAAVTEPLRDLDLADPNAILRAFAANPAFRAATAEELTTESNPYRRPVRPDDLAWLDYSGPMAADDALKLSALLGHRMLRNVYDLDLRYLPTDGNQAAADDGREFYSERNRVLSALAGPILEHHLFSFLPQRRDGSSVTSLAGLKRSVAEYSGQRDAAPGAAFATARGLVNRKDSATFLLLQLTAMVPAARAAMAGGALGEYELAHPGLREYLWQDYQRWTEAAPSYATLLATAGLTAAPAAYWQFYLGSSLARANHLHFLGRHHERLAEFLGALVHYQIDEAAIRRPFSDAIEDGLGTRPQYFQRPGALTGTTLDGTLDTLLAPLCDRFGESAVVSGFARGFADARTLAELHDRDLSEQLAWADDIERYKEAAERIQRKLVSEEIVVDLDTFVESCEETSTTHVHDDHRLVMVERGQMHFWNNVGQRIALSEGDKLLIPLSRLHGSVVLTGSCTYHQPIIPEEMFREFVPGAAA